MNTSTVKSTLKNTILLPLLILSAFSINGLFNLAAFFHSRQIETYTVTPYPMNAHDKSRQALVGEAYGKLPLSFEVNQGQTDARVRFVSRGSGYNLFLTPTESVLTLQAPIAPQTATKSSTTPSITYSRNLIGRGNTQQDVLRMTFVEANPSARVTGLEELPGKSNYILGEDPKRWHTNVPHYLKVKYEDLYAGVDLIYYGNKQQLEYDFIVAPGAEPSSIRFAFDGTQDFEIDAEGDLILSMRGATVRQRKPFIYQEIGGQKHKIDGWYVKTDNQQVGFGIGVYDPSIPLVIDPMLIYSTYLGGSGDDRVEGIATDGAGNVYVAGYTTSPTFPTTAGTFQVALAGSSDAFVTKLDPSGSTLLYSTYLGGTINGNDRAAAVTVDSQGDAYVTGATDSFNFPTTPGAFDPLGDSAYDVFVTKLSPSGSSLIYSTCLGGSGAEEPFAIAIDGTGQAHIAGSTKSLNFPTTPGAFDTSFNGISSNHDAFVTKLNTLGSALVYSTFFGGSSNDQATGIALAPSGNAYVTGVTSSTNLPTTFGAFDNFLGGSGDAFVVKLNATGSGMFYSTYLGGSDSDVGFGIALDASGQAYVTGYATSADFPVTSSAFDRFFGGGVDVFVTKLNSSGSGLIYSTFLGGSGFDVGFAIAVDGSGQAYVTGHTNSSTFPTTFGAFDTVYAGMGFSDAFITKLSASGSTLSYSSYLGGDSNHDEGRSIAIDVAGNVYVGGKTASTSFPTTVGTYDTSYNGGPFDGFISRFQFP